MPLSASITDDTLRSLLESHGLRLNAQQRRRLSWLVARSGAPALWQDGKTPSSRLVIMTHAPNATQADALRRRLPSDAMLVIPCAENPAFDTAKSRFVDYGTIGTAGVDGPHQMWWGGLSWNHLDAPSDAGELPVIVSCFVPGSPAEAAAAALRNSVEARGLPHVVRPIERDGDAPHGAAGKVRFLCSVWEETNRPVLWLDPYAGLRDVPSLPAALGCDFAVRKQRKWRLADHALYFGRGVAAEALLQTWHGLCVDFPDLPTECLLDQAWCLVTSQMPLDTVWLPPTYATSRADATLKVSAVVVHDAEASGWAAPHGGRIGLPLNLQQARKAGRTGAPQVLVPGASTDGRPMSVLIDNSDGVDSPTLAATMDAAVDAFSADAGGFSHLEITLCHTDEELLQATLLARRDGLLLVTAREQLSRGAFRRLRTHVDRGGPRVLDTRVPSAAALVSGVSARH